MLKIKKLIINFFIICCSTLFFVSCATIKTGTHYDEKYYFEGYKTFSWISKKPINKDEKGAVTISPLTLKKITDSIQTHLESKGYQHIDDNSLANFSLSYTVGSREKFTMDYFPMDYRHNWNWYWDGNHHTNDQWHIQSWTQGTLTIDIFDNKNKVPIWHGWAIKTVTNNDRKDPDHSIEKAVSKIFNDFPALIK
jgi:hypothetical protein